MIHTVLIGKNALIVKVYRPHINEESLVGFVKIIYVYFYDTVSCRDVQLPVLGLFAV